MQLLALLAHLEVDARVQSHLSSITSKPEWDDTQLRIHRAHGAVQKVFLGGQEKQYTPPLVLDKKTKVRNEYAAKLVDLYDAEDAVRLSKPCHINLSDARAAVEQYVVLLLLLYRVSSISA